MRRVLVGSGVSLLLLLAGCNHTQWNLFNLNKDKGGGGGKYNDVPTTAALVDYMNKNSERMKTLRCLDVRLTASKGVTQLLSMQLDGMMVARQPRDFRLTARMEGKTAVDLGSNNEEFWYWISKGDNFQFYCSYKDLEAGTVKFMPLPFQPDWIMETMGMADYGPPERYELRDEGSHIKLIENAKSPQGKPVKKVIVFNRKPAVAPTPQVVAYLLLDAKTGAEICSATIHSAQLDPGNGAMLPAKMTLNWPAEKVRLALNLVQPAANDENLPPTAFVRQQLSGIPGLNLATGRPDGQPSSLQHVNGWKK